jgi:DNA-binding SARP family transcriptional activator
MLKLRLLGELEVLRGEERVALPPSRKTRALLAYLASVGRPQRRERLCSMFWEVPDDPRGALRWSMSRLRSVVDEPDHPRIAANRETVAFEANGAQIDLARLRELTADGIANLSAEALEEAAGQFRGEFLEGLDLPGQHDFQAWCVAEREDLRRLQIRILSELVARRDGDPDAALPAARQLAQIDPFNEPARVDLLRLMLASGRRQEAESHFETASRLFREIGPDATERLAAAWRKLLRQAAERSGAEATATAREEPPAAPITLRAQRTTALGAAPAGSQSSGGGLFGRERELAQLLDAAAASARDGRVRVVALLGEPGIGKSRLLTEIATRLRARPVRTLCGHAYDTRLATPFGPWIEALGELPAARGDDTALLGRQKLFAEVAARIVGEEPVALLFEDVQWIDEASADLLHHVARAARLRPVFVVLTARDGELPDNEAMTDVLRNLRRDGMLEEMRLEALRREDTTALVRSIAPAADADHLVAMSAGNPLYAEQLARNLAEHPGALPRSLKELVRDRVERFAPETAELLRWASVIGRVVDIDRLRLAADLEAETFMRGLEMLERRRLLVPVEQGRHQGAYMFGHEMVRQAIYTSLSEPRRRMMHLKIARSMRDDAMPEGTALEVAHHAAAGGDAGMAAESCVAAGRHSMRLFANAEAMALVRQGRRYAEALPEPVRVGRLIELVEIELRASRPRDPSDLIARIEALADRALDHDRPDQASRCYMMLANLRWEGGEWSTAEQDTLRAELVSRGGDDHQRVMALGEAARCLAMLERDLRTAEALVLEAEALGRRVGFEPNAVSDAMALLRCHRGHFDEARTLLQRARVFARRDGDRTGEFLALEHLLTMEIELGRYDEAAAMCGEVVALAAKFPGGSEEPFARALQALCRWAFGKDSTLDAFEEALRDLRVADAKHRLAFAAISAARLLVERGEPREAGRLAGEALAAATALNRRSDIVTALAVLARVAAAEGDADERNAHLDRLGEVIMEGVSENALRAGEEALEQRPADAVAAGA